MWQYLCKVCSQSICLCSQKLLFSLETFNQIDDFPYFFIMWEIEEIFFCILNFVQIGDSLNFYATKFLLSKCEYHCRDSSTSTERVHKPWYVFVIYEGEKLLSQKVSSTIFEGVVFSHTKICYQYPLKHSWVWPICYCYNAYYTK